MRIHTRVLSGSGGWLAIFGLAAIASLPAVRAGYARGQSSNDQAIGLTVDKPLAHLGDTVTLTGTRFTPGSRVTIDLHGPFDATLGVRYGTVAVDQHGNFVERIRLVTYPDKAARDGRTVMVAAISDAKTNGPQEGASTSVQLDPTFSTVIKTRAALQWTALTINGTDVKTTITRAASGYRLGYAGYLRAGSYSAYLKWKEVTGAIGSSAWTFRVGSPYDVYPDPRVQVSVYTVRLGDTVGIAGQYWTPNAVVRFSLGGPNTPPSLRLRGAAVVDAHGEFKTYVTIPGYPDRAARASGAVMLQASASGAAIGDLPEGMAVLLRVSR